MFRVDGIYAGFTSLRLQTGVSKKAAYRVKITRIVPSTTISESMVCMVREIEPVELVAFISIYIHAKHEVVLIRIWIKAHILWHITEGH